MNDIMRFMDEKGRIKTWAAKKEIKFEIIKYISTKFEYGKFDEALFSVKMCKWFEYNIEKLEDALMSGF